MHSTWSDGEWAPRKLAREAATQGLAAVSLTDHDEVGGFAEFAEAARDFGLEVVTGVELSTNDGVDRHLLGYGFDPANEGLLALTRESRADRGERMAKIVARLNDLGLPVDLDEVMAEAGGGAPGRPHAARVLVKRKFVPTFREAFDRYLGDGQPACVAKRKLPIAEAIRALHRAGGVAVVAHPGILGGPETLNSLLELGLDGVEVSHPLHGSRSEAEFYDFAERHDLAMTGGSDFHGPRWGGIHVGAVSISRDRYCSLLDRINRRREAVGLPGLVVPQEK